MSLADALIRRVTRRAPDFVIGGAEDPYLRRWWVIPRNRWFNIYLHEFVRDDDDRALHDHPWINLSILLRGSYVEVTSDDRDCLIERRVTYSAPGWKARLPSAAHRIVLHRDREGNAVPCWTLFVTGPRVRDWGFLCPRRGWVNWRRFTAGHDGARVGLGCDQPADRPL